MASLRDLVNLVRLPHSVFSLPFAAAAFLAARGVPELRTLLWILACVVTARTAAMAYNRWVDKDLDAANPRASDREIPKGTVSPNQALALFACAAVAFLFCASRLNPICFALSPMALAAVVLYSVSKRWTALSHFLLGICLAMSPAGAWLAVRGTLEPAALLLSGAVVLWLAGFDILYAILDIEFDRGAGVRSIPAAVGERASLWTARVCHLGSALLLLAVPLALPIGTGYIAAAGGFSLFLMAQHFWIGNANRSRIASSVFVWNGWAALAFGIVVCFTAAA